MPSLFPAELMDRVHACGVVAVLVIDEADQAVPLAKSLLDGGIDVMELTLRTDAALDALSQIKQRVPQMLCGAGTVLRVDQVQAVHAAGGAFAVAPGTNRNVVLAATQSRLPFAPGIVTPSDIEAAVELGCHDLKFFPAQPSGGVQYLKSMAAPYNHLGLRYIPLGGINQNNMIDYLSQANVPAVGGSWIARREQIQSGDWPAITANAARARRAIDSLRAA